MTNKNKEERPLISVLIPAYNIKEYLPACLDSVLAQTYDDLEIVLVDDGSTDGTGAVCDAYAKKDPRIRVIHKVNEGLSVTRNLAVREATGEYIGFVDGDDIAAPKLFETLYEELRIYRADISACGFYLYDGEQAYETWSQEKGLISGKAAVRRALRQGQWDVVLWNKLYKRELFDGVEFPVGELFEDTGVYYKVWLKADRFAFTDKPLYYYRKRPGSMTDTETGIKRVKVILGHLETEKSYFEDNCPALVPDVSAVIRENILLVNTLCQQSGRTDDPEYRDLRDRFKREFGAIMRLKTLKPDKKVKAVLIRAGLYGPIYRLIKGRQSSRRKGERL